MNNEELAIRFACALISSGHYPTAQSQEAACVVCEQAWALANIFASMRPEFEGVSVDSDPRLQT